MKKILFAILAVASLNTYTLQNCLNAGGYDERKGEMWRARDNFKVKNYEKAIEELRKIVDAKPAEADAYLLMGDCYMKITQPNDAALAYERYLILRPGYGKELAPKLVQIGDILLSKNQLSEARKNYSLAISYNQLYRSQIAENFFQHAKRNLYQNNIDQAENLFDMAITFNPLIASKINQTKSDFAMHMLSKAKARPKNERAKFINTAKRYVSQEIVERIIVPPKIVKVFNKEYTGVGMGEKDIIPEGLPYFGKDILKGDKIIIKGKRFKFLDSVWGEYEDYAETICGISVEIPDTIGVRAPAGEKITIEIKRTIE
jgi:tetratricopeptide (TPR) repeat protein